MIDDIDDEEWGPQARALFIAVKESLESPGAVLARADRSQYHIDKLREDNRMHQAACRARKKGLNIPARCRACKQQFPYQKGVYYCGAH